MSVPTCLRRAVMAACLALGAALPATADEIATVLSIRGIGQGPGGPIEAGDRLEDGVVIRTNGDTQIQLRFDDGTLMAIGPNSELEVTSVLMGGAGQASRFAINATGGAFRFLSGDSREDAYEITTPTASIGIRGTEFDISVFKMDSFGQEVTMSAVALYRGRLELCLQDASKCWQFRGSCYLAEADLSRNRVRGLRPAEARDYLANFPYAVSQRGLLPELRTITNACNKYFRGVEDDDDGDRSAECFFDGEVIFCPDDQNEDDEFIFLE